jgi:hypothetical protein
MDTDKGRRFAYALTFRLPQKEICQKKVKKRDFSHNGKFGFAAEKGRSEATATTDGDWHKFFVQTCILHLHYFPMISSSPLSYI